MPTYEYRCPSCKYEFEKLQSMSDEPIKKCPKCGKKVQRLMGSGSGIVFKGSGFYQTDYKKSNQKPETRNQKPEAGSSQKPESSNQKPKTGPSEK